MFPASSNLTLEKAVDKLNKLEHTINEYVQLYESHKYKSPKTRLWIMQSKAWINRIITAIKNKQATIQGTNESVVTAFETLKNGYLEHTHQVQEINKQETPELKKLQQINREFLFVEPNLNKIIEMGFKTESEIRVENEENLLRQGYRQISLTDMSLLGNHATVNFESIYGGRVTQEGRFERSRNGSLMLMPPGKRKMGWQLSEPAYAKFTTESTRKTTAVNTLEALHEMERERQGIQKQPALNLPQLYDLADKMYKIIERTYTTRHEGISMYELEHDMLNNGISYQNTAYAMQLLEKNKRVREHNGGWIPFNEYKQEFRGNQGVLF